MRVLRGVGGLHLFTGGWQFVRISCQHCEVIDDGLEVGDLSQHGDFSVLIQTQDKDSGFLRALLSFSQTFLTLSFVLVQ